MEVKSSVTIEGLGLFTKNNHIKDSVVFRLEGTVSDYPTRESIHIGRNKHITDKWGTFMNHSFNPTTKICGYNVIALKDIKKGEELTFNYNESEISMACPFKVGDTLVCGLMS